MQDEIKDVTIGGKFVQDLGSSLGFRTVTILLLDPGGYLCIFLDLLIGSSFFVMFHTS
jgi:hypothetical protein